MHSEELSEDLQLGSAKHLRDYLRMIAKRKGMLAAIVCISFLVAMLSTFSKTPIYTASTRVLIEKNLDVGRLEGFGGYMVWDPDFQATQLELIRSFNVALRVAKELELDSKYSHLFFQKKTPSSSWSNLIQKSASAFFARTISFVDSLISHGSFVPEIPEEQSAAKAKTPKIQPDLPTKAEHIAAMIQSAIMVEPIRDTKIISVSYSHSNPEIAQMVANGIVQAYIDETLDIKTSTARQTLKWMTAKAEDEQKKLALSEQALQKYMRDYDIVTVENKLAVLPERLSNFSNELSTAQTKEKEYEALYSQIEQKGRDYNLLETIPLFAESSVLRELRTQLLTSEQNIRELARKYGEKHPVMKQALDEQRMLIKEKRSEIDRIIASTRNGYELAKAKVRDLSGMMAETKAELMDMNERFIQYTILNRDKDMNRTVYDALSASIKKTDVTAQTMDVKIWAVKKADLPSSPSEPNKKKDLLKGLLGGLLGGTALIFFLEYLDNTAGPGREIEERYNLTVLGTIEDLSGKKHSIDTFVLDNPLSPTAESYRLVRSALMLSTPDHPPRIILVTSMVQQEGKTTTTTNLAHILSQNDKKVLIIDCDMRRPRQHSMFGFANSYGLSNYLSGNIDQQQSLIRQAPENPVSLIPAGPLPPNPAELLSSGKMRLLLKETSAQFDFVLLDSPPVQQVTDSLVLGPLADGTLLVVRAGNTTYEMLDSGIKRLRDGHTHILGIVLNRLKKKNAAKGYYGYYSYYSNYGYYEKDNSSSKKKKA